MVYFLKITIVCLVLAATLPLSLFAQSFEISASPPFPKEGERVLISVSSFSFDVQNSLITWKQEGEILLEGIGLTSYTVPSANNQTIVVEVTNRATGEKITKGIPILTSEVDLLWETFSSYTPPFYKGKALPALEASVNVVAIPKRSDMNELSYSWEKEYSREAAQSGRGKNSFSYIANPLEQANAISVTVSNPESGYQAQEDLIIRYGNSEVLFYEEDERLGTLFNRAMKNGDSVGDDKKIALTAIPYFITADSIASKTLSMLWSVNGTQAPEQVVKNKVMLSGIPTGISGPATVSIFIKNSARLFEEGRVGISLEF